MFEPEVVTEFLRRSYFAVDGLWFVKLEERSSFEQALQVDREVWEIMGKIQARKARELVRLSGEPLDDVVQCLALKFAAEGHEYELRRPSAEVAEVVIRVCPWLEIMRQSGREHLAAQVGRAICATEGHAWAREFGPGLEFALVGQLCDGRPECRYRFTRTLP